MPCPKCRGPTRRSQCDQQSDVMQRPASSPFKRDSATTQSVPRPPILRFDTNPHKKFIKLLEDGAPSAVTCRSDQASREMAVVQCRLLISSTGQTGSQQRLFLQSLL